MHRLLTDAPGRQMLMLGNEAIARGALEAGVALASTYPGTPSSEIALHLFQISRETDLTFEYATNEKVAMEMAAAAANAGLRAMCVMKHVGLNVAADALMTLAYVGVSGAMVIVTADDPFMFSSQNEQDNRYYAKLSGLPMLEPSSVEEARPMMAAAFDLSEQLGEPVLFRTTTRINHSTAPVALGSLGQRWTRGEFIKEPMRCVTVPAVSRRLHVKLLENYEKAAVLSEASPYNQVTGSGTWGVICNGVSHGYVQDAVADLNLAGRVRILRIGFSYPLPQRLITDFVAGCERVLVVEEGEPFLEEGARAAAQASGITVPIRGKGADLFSRLYEFDPALVRRCIAAYFGLEPPADRTVDRSDVPDLPQRPPNLCAGCSHRATFYAVKKAAEDFETICPTDIGCYTLGFLPPLSMGDFLVCMGSSAGTACGFAATTTGKKVIAFIGDSTFFHSGIPGLINAVFNNHDITLVILDNGTTAMTGHQPNPGVDMAALGIQGFGRVSIEAVVRALGVGHVAVVRPYRVEKCVAAIREAIAFQGVSVVISQELCALYARSLKRPRAKAFRVGGKCRNHRDCINLLGCPAFYLDGEQVCIDAALCTGCSVCAQICPEHAIVPVKKS